MDKKTVVNAVLVDEYMTISRVEICQKLNIPDTLLQDMEDLGLFDANQKQLNQQTLSRIEAACRIHQHLGVNLPGVVLVLELLDQLEVLKQQLAILEH